MRRPALRPIPIGPVPLVLGIVALVGLWLVRPIWHGLAMLFWTAPLVWLPPLALLAVGGCCCAARAAAGRTLEDLREGRAPADWLVAFPVLAFFLVRLRRRRCRAARRAGDRQEHDYEPIRGLPAGGQVRLVPREVAEQNASSAFNSPTETLTDFRIVNTDEGPELDGAAHAAGRVPHLHAKSQGLVELDAEQTARSLRQIDAELQPRPGCRSPTTCAGGCSSAASSSASRSRSASRRRAARGSSCPTWSTRASSSAGRCSAASSSSPRTARSRTSSPRRPRAGRSSRTPGRIFPDTQARRVQDAYQYERGLWNAWFVHEDQTRITDTEVNRQPYLIDFDRRPGPQWVSVAEPYGRAFAASAIFLTDATTGRTRIWRVPRRTSLSGNRRALQAVRAVSIPGIDFGDGTPGSGNFRVVEPRPVFVGGRVVYLSSIIPNSANAVSKTVVVDAETNKLVAIFDNDRDPEAEAKTLRYIRTGEIPDEAIAPGAEEATGATEEPSSGDEHGHDDDPVDAAARPAAAARSRTASTTC